ncbi:NIL domain-containing protein [Oscillatoria laete-virens NRMC-F 0139]|nr:NIL domain-containing protein [Oscillatoria laete-virens]MDL5052992.1 NIL domain-containing protein [Oscillatoria laete-virens NRMC-F 0139]
MSEQTHRYWLTYSAELVQRPLIWEMAQKFKVVFNIKQASITKDVGIMALELTGQREEIKAAVKWFEQNNVQVEPVEINTIEG